MTLAIVLAGSKNDGLLRTVSDETSEAMIKIGRKCMVEYVVDALTEAERVEEIIVVGPEKLNMVFTEQKITVVQGGDTIVQSLLNGLKCIENLARPILVITADIPLITGKIIDEFLGKSSNETADIIYPIISKEANELKYPGNRRTYVKLKEGVFTGGNIFLVNPAIIDSCSSKVEELVRLRKSPLRLANYIGFLYILKYFSRTLSLNDAEKRIGQLFKIKGKALVVSHPEIGIDVDKPSDMELVKDVLVND